MFNSLSGIWREDLFWLICFPWIFVNTCPYRIVHSAWPELGSFKVETVLVDVSCKLPDNGLEQFRSLCSCKHICGTSTQCHGRKKWREKIGMSRSRRSKRVSQIREISTLPGFACSLSKGCSCCSSHKMPGPCLCTAPFWTLASHFRLLTPC